MISLNKHKSVIRSKLEGFFFSKNPSLINEPIKLTYESEYTPDFVGEKNKARLLKGEHAFVIEVKGWTKTLSTDLAKMKKIAQQYAGKVTVVMIFDNADAAHSKTKTKRQWAEENGMRAFSKGEAIPSEITE
jgi:hypothetical protein